MEKVVEVVVVQEEFLLDRSLAVTVRIGAELFHLPDGEANGGFLLLWQSLPYGSARGGI